MTVSPRPIPRIDLRGAELSAARLRAALPRGGVDVDTVLPKVRPIVDAVAERGAQAALEYGELFDGVRPATVRVPRERLDAALTELDPDGAGGPRGRNRAGPRRARRPAPHRHHDHARAWRDRHRTLGARRAGRSLRSGRQRRLPVERRDERGPRADGGRGLAGDRQPAAGRRAAVGLPHPTILAAAALLGVDEVWAVGGAQVVRPAGLRRHRHRRIRLARST